MEATVNVRLLTRWADRMPNDIVSVSNERAEYLEKEGIGRIIDRPAEVVVEEKKPRKK